MAQETCPDCLYGKVVLDGATDASDCSTCDGEGFVDD